MICWITDSLGTASWGEVSELPDIHILDVRDLVDKGGNPREVVRLKIEQATRYLQDGKKVIVCCDYGISRSNAIAAGIISKHQGKSLNDAIRCVVSATDGAQIRLEVLSIVRDALGSAPEKSIISTELPRRVILITGGTGFIGSTVLRRLKPEWRFVAPSHQEIDLTRDVVKLDLLVKQEHIDMIVHLANPRVYGTNESLGMTLIMLKTVLDVCVENTLRLLYLSGWEIYSGYKDNELRADELLAPCPGGTYGQTKLLCEALIDHFHRHYDLKYTLLRSSPVYGPTSERPRFIWNFLEKALRNEEIVTHQHLNGFPKLDLLFVDDLCRAIVGAIEHNVQGDFNVGTGALTSTAEIAQMIVKLVGSESRIRHLQIEDYATNVSMDYSRALAVFGWQPVVDVQQGLEILIKTAQLERKR